MDNGDKEEKELYHLEFPKCPVCGSDATVTHEAWLDEIDAGRIPESSKDTLTATEHRITPLIDPKNPPKFTAGALEYIFDVCANCGTMRCSSVKKHVGVVGMTPGQQQQSRQGPPFGGMFKIGG